ncbi:signal recognition particle protein [Hujiaoplasma nucleasis]|uniref:Signal recognition particle protein n=1 Tax=Hujiaoplasma nucleasis TaxID=2725268 RepID=A0A7L6N459_9MOLU|nr:signal recognition particle protein [Hujiaoplasma nucleasis]QLY40272.1 signal recognition particle protein [Hujiaoplasma nucleasis]
MAFEDLTGRFQMALRRLTGKAKLTENDIDEMMREVRLSLLEADVNYKVVKEFTEDVKVLAYGEKILKGLKPGEQVVKIVNDELTKLMGEETSEINLKTNDMTVMLMVGLQGAGKTTTAGKLANFIKNKHNKKPMLIAADVYRPAAIEQLQTVGQQLGIEVYQEGLIDPETIVKNGLKYAKEQAYDLVIIDTAGRLHIDDSMMDEIQKIEKLSKPDEVLLTVDAMTGQDAVNVAETFNKALNLTGCILTKLDGDTRGGAALSIRKMTGVPIKFSGTGEKLEDIEVFHPERMASRILGMGDILSLVEKATQEIDEEEALSMMEKMMTGKFNYNDLLKQMKMIKRMGKFSGILKMMPGMKSLGNMDKVDDKQLEYIEAIVGSMTEEERKKPELINRSSSRRNRIARGSGRSYSEINKLVDMLEKQQTLMRRMQGMNPDSLQNMAQGNFQPKESRSERRDKMKRKGGFRF